MLNVCLFHPHFLHLSLVILECQEIFQIFPKYLICSLIWVNFCVNFAIMLALNQFSLSWTLPFTRIYYHFVFKLLILKTMTSFMWWCPCFWFLKAVFACRVFILVYFLLVCLCFDYVWGDLSRLSVCFDIVWVTSYVLSTVHQIKLFPL